MDQVQNRRILFAALVSAFSVVWSFAVGGMALAAARSTRSPSLFGFGLASMIDSAASVVLVWYFGEHLRDPVRAKRLETIAMRAVALVLILAGAYVVFRSISQLRAEAVSATSTFGMFVAAASVAILPFVAAVKLRLAANIPSAALRSDGVLTAGAATLSALTLVAIALEGTSGLWWLDPAIALVIAGALAAEGIRTLRTE